MASQSDSSLQPSRIAAAREPPLLQGESSRPSTWQSSGSGSRSRSPSASFSSRQDRPSRVRLNDDGESVRIVLTPDAKERSCTRQVASVTMLLATSGALVYMWSTAPEEDKDDFLTYGTIPIVAALVGWATNSLAIKMTFYPLEFRGFCPNVAIFGLPLFGWQGMIPGSCEDMARQAVELMTTRLMDVQGVFGQLDGKRAAAEIRPVMEAIVPKIVETIAMEYFTRVWTGLPAMAQKEIKNKALADSTQAITDMIDSANADMSSAIDVNELLVKLFTKDKQLMNDVFEKCAEYEFWFIRVAGFVFGLLFGFVQMALWYIYPQAWVLPAAGFLHGYLTNFIALKIIFVPEQPRQCWCCTCHGLFLRRQKEVARVYAELFSTKVLTAENLLMGIINGSGSDQLFEQLDQSLSEGIDSAVKSKRVAKMMIGSDQYAAMKKRVTALIRQDLHIIVQRLTPYLDDTLNVRTTLEDAMCELSSQEFADMLHPVFEEGEWKLTLIGGLIGVVVGLLQVWAQRELGLK